MPPPSSPKIKVLGQRYSINNPADRHMSHWTLPFSQHYVCTNLSLFCLPQWCLLPSWESSAFSYLFTHNFQMVTSKMAHVSVLWLLNKQNTGFLLGKHSHTSMKPWQPIHSCLSKAATHCMPAPPWLPESWGALCPQSWSLEVNSFLFLSFNQGCLTQFLKCSSVIG